MEVNDRSIVLQIVRALPGLLFDSTIQLVSIGSKVSLVPTTSKLFICNNFERGALGFVCIFDLGRKNTFESIRDWIDQIKLNCSVENPTILVLGNKKDLDHKQVSSEEIAEF